jgi:hypothetical protein
VDARQRQLAVVGVAEDDVAVTYPAAYDPIDDSDMLAPLANAPALAKALANSNAAWKEYVPSPLTVCYTDTALTTAARVFRMPITPSADAKVAPDDGMTYDIIHEVLTGTGTTAITITVEEQSAGGGWSGIYGPTATAAAATSWVQVTTNVVIAATTDELRFTYSRGTDPTTPMSATVIPAPEAPTVRQTSGFWPYDEAFTAIAGVPVNTEIVNRPTRNIVALLNDRRQCLLSFCQESTTPLYDLDGTTAAATQWTLVAYGMVSVPYAPQVISAKVAVIASVDGGATTGLIRASAQQGDVYLNATGAVVTSALSCLVIDAETLDARAEISIYAKKNTGQLTSVHAVNVDYAPSHSTTLRITTPDAPASMSTLQLCARDIERRVMQPWAQPCPCYQGNTTDLTVRRWSWSVSPAVQRAQMCIIRATQSGGTAQSATVIAQTTASGVPASPATDAITVPTPTTGTEAYLDLAGDQCNPVPIFSSDGYDVTSPAVSVNRLIPLTEALASAVERVEVTNSIGACMFVTAVRPPSGYQDI